MRLLLSLVLVFNLMVWPAKAQNNEVIDRIIAVVGQNMVMRSEFEAQRLNLMGQGMKKDEKLNCSVMEELLLQKLLLNQAQLDSLKVTEEQIQAEIDMRLRYFISQFGSEERFEKEYGKTISQFKEEFHDPIREIKLIQAMQAKLSGDIAVTPSEVRVFFNKMDQDSLPFINSEIEVAQIVAKPVVSEAAKNETISKLNDFKNRVRKGEDFAAFAVLYSEDPGSAKSGGDLGLQRRGTFVPEFEAAAFSLAKGEVSEIIESPFGYHLLQLMDRRGEMVQVRHILLKPRTDPADLINARNKLDSIYQKILTVDTMTFALAAELFSDDEETRYNGGVLINPLTGTTRFEVSQLSPQVFFVADKLDIGEVSQPALAQLPDGNQVYRILKVLKRTEPHRANLKDDYQLIQAAALDEKKGAILQKWTDEKIQKTYIKIDESFSNCGFDYGWVK